METAVIFGSEGQDGRFLRMLLEKRGLRVVGVSRSGGEKSGEVSNRILVWDIIKNERPRYIFHFAAISSPSHEFLFENNKAIGEGTLNILEGIREFSPTTKVFLSGSALQFENTGKPINEETPFQAESAYGLARIYSTYAGRYFRNSFKLPIYTGYFFNHDSQWRTENHISQKIAQTALRIADGSNERLEIGNINVKKEFTFAGDMMNAVWTLVNQEQVFEAVLGSGKAYSIGQWTEYCFKRVGLNWKDHVDIKTDYKPAYQTLVSDPKLIFSLGWRPQFSFEQLADLMLGKS